MPRRNPALLAAPLITFPQLALTLSVRQQILRDLCLAAGIHPHRPHARGQDRLTYPQAEQVAALLSESATRRA